MSIVILMIVGVLSGICAALGIGGGFVLLIYLTAIASVKQLNAQLINLIFFLPIGGLSLIMHFKHKLIEKQVVIPSVIGGAAGVLVGVLIASNLSNQWLSKAFGVFILIVGIKELFAKPKKEKIEEKSDTD